ncbi:MAG: sulfatase [Planctomycetaceae bacterium]
MNSLFASGLFALAVFLPNAATAAEPSRPNILFAFADDWGRYASVYAQVDGPGTINDVVSTPNIDRVARDGVLFRNAFVPAPSCTPCRSTILSGQYFWRTGRGAILQGAVWDEAIPSFPLLLHDAGYHIGQTSKVWSPGTPNDAPFGGARFAYDKAGGRFNQFSQNVTAAVDKGVPVEKAKQALYDEVAANFEAFLADRDEGKPFLYWFGPTNVHRKWVKGSGKALWGIEPDDLEGKLPDFLPDVPTVREDVADYLGEAQAFDAALGVLLAKLEAAGEFDNTLVVVSGDHGAPGFPHGKCNLYDFGTAVSLAVRGPGVEGGRVVDDFVNLMDLAPTLLEVGGAESPAVMTGRSFANVLHSDKAGQVDAERTFVVTGRERHVAAAREGFVPYPQRAIRTKGHLYIVNFKPDRWPMGDPVHLADGHTPDTEALIEDTYATFLDMDSSPTKAWLVTHRNDPQWKKYYELAFTPRPREELYVLADDPDQVHNVAADAQYADVRAELESKLMDELRRANDPRVTGDGTHFETPPYSGPLPQSQTRRPRRAAPQPKPTNK